MSIISATIKSFHLLRGEFVTSRDRSEPFASDELLKVFHLWIAPPRIVIEMLHAPVSYYLSTKTRKTLIGIGILAILIALCWKNNGMSPLKKYPNVALKNVRSYIEWGFVVPCEKGQFSPVKLPRCDGALHDNGTKGHNWKWANSLWTAGLLRLLPRELDLAFQNRNVFGLRLAFFPPILAWSICRDTGDICILPEMHPSVFLSTRCASAFTYVLLKWSQRKQMRNQQF